jgi:hypothetical protein
MGQSGKRGTPSPDATEVLDTLLEHLAAESVEPGDTPRENAWARALRQKVDTHLAALRRQLVLARPSPRRAERISDEILALPRTGILERLESFRQAPEVRIAHLELSELTTDDLRQLLAELESTETTLT